jgi:glutathione S-transferase
MIKIYGDVASRTFRILWALEEAQVPYEFIPIALSKGEHKTPEFLKVNPYGKVLVLVHGDLKLYASGAQCLYVAQLYPERGLLPASTAGQALCYQWMFFATSELEEPMWTKVRHRFSLPEELRVAKMLEVAQYDFDIKIKKVEDGIERGPFLLGEQFTCADILVGQTLFWALKASMLKPSARVAEYIETLKSRPSFRAALNR